MNLYTSMANHYCMEQAHLDSELQFENKVTKGLIYNQQRLDSNDPSGYLSIGFQSLRIFDYSLGGR